VWLSEGDLHSMATRLGMPVDGFTRQFVRLVDDRLSLVERTNGDCVFWDRAAGCTVYEVRPEQCRTWPFWPGHLRTENDWKALQRTCPGAGRGELHSLEEVEAAARRAAEVLRP
jgi:Fe-S-cluster containining protein